jgi:hypothetical protein
MVMQKHEGVINMTTQATTMGSEGKRLTAGRNTTYGQRMRQLILAGFANRPVVRMLRREFPGCRCTAESVSSMRWVLRKEGHHVFTSHQAPKQRADYTGIHSSALGLVQTIIGLTIDAIDVGFNKEEASLWVRLNA